MAIPKWSRRTGLVALSSAGACTLFLGYLVVSGAMETGTSAWAIVLVIAIALIAAATALITKEGLPWGRRWHAWLQPLPIAYIYIAIFAAFGLAGGVLSQIKPAPEKGPSGVEEGIDRILAEVRPRPAATPRILLKLPGIWGEPGCAVTYRFQVRGQALLVDSVRYPPGTAAHHLVATIERAAGDVVNVTGEQPEPARGKAAVFTYITNGVTERLTWDDRVSPVPLTLDRCG